MFLRNTWPFDTHCSPPSSTFDSRRRCLTIPLFQPGQSAWQITSIVPWSTTLDSWSIVIIFCLQLDEHTNEHGASSEDTRRKEKGKKLKSRREIEATPSIPQFAAVTTFRYNFPNFRFPFFQAALFRSFLLRIRSNLQVLRIFFNRIPTGCPI